MMYALWARDFIAFVFIINNLEMISIKNTVNKTRMYVENNFRLIFK